MSLNNTPFNMDIVATTQKELYGWYAYAWAAEPFMVVAVATYIPNCCNHTLVRMRF